MKVNLFSFVFWKKLKTPKSHFEINWPLNDNILFFSRANPNETLKFLTGADIIHFVIDNVIKKAYDFFI